MWIAEFKVWHEESVAINLSKRFNVRAATYYLNAFVDRGKLWVNKVVIVEGKDRDGYIRALTQEKRITINRVEGNQVFYRLPGNKQFHTTVVDKSIFFIKPQVITGGFEHWTVASWEKKRLLDLYKAVKRQKQAATIDLISLKEEPLNLFVPNVFTKLTEKQRWAFLHAYRYGYYELPRQMSLEDIAEKIKVPRNTYREHLRKAENKLLCELAKQGDLGLIAF
ncbi:helix-turn-helix domain-containing protein [Candidatus Micrarchaeota archaeon]|nr:helix-turn-helix domain-containing protein [Candidatus Micrarchaeota archaeon]